MEHEEYLAKYEHEATDCTLCKGTGSYIVKGEEFMCGTCPAPLKQQIRSGPSFLGRIVAWVVRRLLKSV